MLFPQPQETEPKSGNYKEKQKDRMCVYVCMCE